MVGRWEESSKALVIAVKTLVLIEKVVHPEQLGFGEWREARRDVMCDSEARTLVSFLNGTISVEMTVISWNKVVRDPLIGVRGGVGGNSVVAVLEK